MNKYFCLLAMLCLVIASCDDEHNDKTEEIKTPFWKYPHLDFVGLNGPVTKVLEKVYSLSEADEEEVVVLDMRFNSAGLMTYYNSTGVESDQQTRDVWQTLAYYSYQYDDKGRMIQAIVTPLGEEPVVYDLVYGEHTNYVPLIFPLGAMDYFLVQGLERIKSADGTISYLFDGEKATYKESTWNGDTETTYFYDAGHPYPVKRVVNTSRGEVILSSETTVFTYDEDGRLLIKDSRSTENEVETGRTIIRYANDRFLLPISKKMDLGTLMFDWSYSYDSAHRLSKVDFAENKNSDDEVIDKEEYNYLSSDGYGNWTDSHQLQSSVVDWTHQDGYIGVRREIMY